MTKNHRASPWTSSLVSLMQLVSIDEYFFPHTCQPHSTHTTYQKTITQLPEELQPGLIREVDFSFHLRFYLTGPMQLPSSTGSCLTPALNVYLSSYVQHKCAPTTNSTTTSHTNPRSADTIVEWVRSSIRKQRTQCWLLEQILRGCNHSSSTYRDNPLFWVAGHAWTFREPIRCRPMVWFGTFQFRKCSNFLPNSHIFLPKQHLVSKVLTIWHGARCIVPLELKQSNLQWVTFTHDTTQIWGPNPHDGPTTLELNFVDA